MRKETYIKMTQPFRENPKLAKSLHMANKILTGFYRLSVSVALDVVAQRSPSDECNHLSDEWIYLRDSCTGNLKLSKTL